MNKPARIVAVPVEDDHRASFTNAEFAYATAGIPHYWVIDGERAVVHVHGKPDAGDYAAIGTVRFGEPLAVPGTDRTIVLD